MIRYIILVTVAILGACAEPADIVLGSDGKPLPRLYRISASDDARILYNMADGINALRRRSGLAPVAINPYLNASAATHARDMAVQNRPWHFGSDGSSPLQRLERVGYQGTLIGEAISETYETENETLAAWIADPKSRTIILDKTASEMGFSWFQEPNGKIWWMLVVGRGQ